MRRHILGIFIGLLAFGFGLLSTPISFKNLGNGQGTNKDLSHPCSFSNFVSSYSENLNYWSCSFNDELEAREDFDDNVSRYRVISIDFRRAVVSYSVGHSTSFCVFRLHGRQRQDICSDSLKTILVFEDQRL